MSNPPASPPAGHRQAINTAACCSPPLAAAGTVAAVSEAAVDTHFARLATLAVELDDMLGADNDAAACDQLLVRRIRDGLVKMAKRAAA